MNEVLIATIVSLTIIGSFAAVVLYFVAQKFQVFEDPRIDEVEASLPNANCGGCGFAGCRNFAEACVKSDDMAGLFCPPGGNDTMKAVASILGKEAQEQAPLVAVLRCNGEPENRKRTSVYDGVTTCSVESSLYGGDTDCQYGCLGHGDCVVVCDFDAIHIDPKTMLPVVIDDKCTACGACVKACPKTLLELRKKNKKDRKIYVSCMNCDRGGPAKKACSVACIGCGLCVKECAFDAITINNNLAFIDADKCRLCRKCAPVCPTHAIIEVGFPPAKPKPVKEATGELSVETASAPEPKPVRKKLTVQDNIQETITPGIKPETKEKPEPDNDTDPKDKPEGDDKTV